jgi:quinol monooxygenase YgiN
MSETGRFVIAAFKPKPGSEQQLAAAAEKHWRVLRAENLVSERPRYAMQAEDGTIVEVFEWRSAQAIEQAHSNPAVLALWAEFDAACDYIPVGTLAEAQHPFSEFKPLPM